MKMKRSLLFVLLGLAALVVSLGIFLVAKVIPEFGNKKEESTGTVSRPVASATDKDDAKDQVTPTDGDRDASPDGTAPVDPKELTTITFAIPKVSEIAGKNLRLFN